MQFPPILVAMLPSQLFALSNILQHLKKSISQNSNNTEASLAPQSDFVDFAASSALPASSTTGSPYRPTVTSSPTIFDAKDDSDSDIEDFEENQSQTPPPAILESRIPNPTNLLRFQLDAPAISVIYVPEAEAEASPFVFLDSFLEPSKTLEDHYLHFQVSDFKVNVDPLIQTVEFGVNVDECFKIRASERSYLPECSDRMLPKSGWYTQRILAVTPLPNSTLQPVQIQNSFQNGFAVDLGSVVISLPLGLPKLFSLALSDIYRAFTSPEPSQNSEREKIPSISAESSSNASKNYEKHDHQRLPSSQPHGDVLLDSLRLGESLIFETGVSVQTRFSLPRLRINLEIPLHQDMTFSLPLRRRERMVLEAEEIVLALHTFEAKRNSAHAHRTLSGSFSRLEISVEQDWFDFYNEESEFSEKHSIPLPNPPNANNSQVPRVVVLSMEGKSANDMDMTPENINLEWRDQPAPSSVLTAKAIQHAPFAVPNSEMGANKQAMSPQEFQNFSSSPSGLSVTLTVHNTTLTLSPGIYTFILDAYDEYARIHESKEPAQMEHPKFCPVLVDYRSKFGMLHLHVEQDPLIYFDASESDQMSSLGHKPSKGAQTAHSPVIYDIELDHIRLIQTGRYLGSSKSVMAVEVGAVDLRPFVHSVALAGQEHLPHLSYAQCHKVEEGVGIASEDSTYLVEIRNMNFSWTFSDVWPSKVAGIFTRLPHTAYQFEKYRDLVDSRSEQRRQTSNFIFNSQFSAFSIWSTPPDLRSPLDGSSAPRLVTCPQLVLIPRHCHLSIDLSTWIYHVFVDRAEIFVALDRDLVKPKSKASPGMEQTATMCDYWINRGHEYSGQLGTSTVTCVVSNEISESSLKCSLEIDTSASQVLALELLYDSYLHYQAKADQSSKKGSTAGKTTFQTKSDLQTLHEAFNSEDLDASMFRSRSRSSQSSIQEPRVSVETDVSKNLPSNIVSWDYMPPDRPKVPLKLRFSVLPIDFVWKLRSDEEDSKAFISLQFSQLEARYDVDENDTTHLEVQFKGLDGFTYLAGDQGMHFFGFDPNGGHYRRMLMSFVMDTWSSDLDQLQNDLKGVEVAVSRIAKFRLTVLPMQLTCNLLTFPFMHRYYKQYSQLYNAYNPPLEGETGSSLISSLFDVIATSLSLSSLQHASSDPSTPSDAMPGALVSIGEANSAAKTDPSKSSNLSVSEPAGPFFRRYFVSDLHLRLNISGVGEAKLRLPSINAENVSGGFGGVARELRAAYVPRWQTALSSVIGAFPGLKLARTVTQGLYAMVLVPLEEAKQGRSMTYGFVKTFGSTVWDAATETVALTAQAAGVAYAGLGAVGKIFDRRGPDAVRASHQQAHVPSPTHVRDGASQSVQSFVEGVQAASDNIQAPIQKFQGPDGSYWLLFRDLPLALPGTILYPLTGAVKGASELLQGTAAHMRSDHTTVHSSAPVAAPSSFLTEDEDTDSESA
jgi:hypothetical protein